MSSPPPISDSVDKKRNRAEDSNDDAAAAKKAKIVQHVDANVDASSIDKGQYTVDESLTPSTTELSEILAQLANNNDESSWYTGIEFLNSVNEEEEEGDFVGVLRQFAFAGFEQDENAGALPRHLYFIGRADATVVHFATVMVDRAKPLLAQPVLGIDEEGGCRTLAPDFHRFMHLLALGIDVVSATYSETPKLQSEEFDDDIEENPDEERGACPKVCAALGDIFGDKAFVSRIIAKTPADSSDDKMHWSLGKDERKKEASDIMDEATKTFESMSGGRNLDDWVRFMLSLEEETEEDEEDEQEEQEQEEQKKEQEEREEKEEEGEKKEEENQEKEEGK